MRKTFPFKNFIQLVEQRVPKGINIVDYISNTISLGKDACYRRLRGEVEFSMSEIVQIASDLSISLDELIGINKEDQFIVESCFMTSNDIQDDYEKILGRAIEHLKDIQNIGKTTIYFICESLPMLILGKYRVLQKLRFYNWYYSSLSNSEKLSEFEVQENTFDLLDELFDILSSFNTEYIVDKNLLLSVIHHINFFYSLNKISIEEVNEIKNELESLISDLEYQATRGCNKKGNSIRVYSSHMLIEASSVLADNEHKPRLVYNLYSANTIATADTKTCVTYKNWMASMKKSCSLISETGDIERTKFFNNLRNALKQLPI